MDRSRTPRTPPPRPSTSAGLSWEPSPYVTELQRPRTAEVAGSPSKPRRGDKEQKLMTPEQRKIAARLIELMTPLTKKSGVRQRPKSAVNMDAVWERDGHNTGVLLFYLGENEDAVARKLLDAACPAREVHGNPCLEYIKRVILPKTGSFSVAMKENARDPIAHPKHYRSFPELARDWKRGRIRPSDLKKRMAEDVMGTMRPFQTMYNKWMVDEQETKLANKRASSAYLRWRGASSTSPSPSSTSGSPVRTYVLPDRVNNIGLK